MFKIRTPKSSDFKIIEELLKNNSQLGTFTELQKIALICQNFIPHNFRPAPSIHIAQEGKNMLGFVILKCSSKSNNSWQIENVFVIDEERNKGLGEELLRYVLSVYGSSGVEHFLAEVDSQNFPALSLFHECGFRRYAKFCFFEKEIDVKTISEAPPLDMDFILRQQSPSDLTEVQKLDLSLIPPDLRPALGRSKEYFNEKKNAKVLIDKSRGLLIGWADIQKLDADHCFIELLAHPGWSHLYEQFLNTIISDCISFQNNNFKLTVKVVDYNSELMQILTKLGFLTTETRELLVRTIWQRVKERKKKKAAIGVPYTAPT